MHSSSMRTVNAQTARTGTQEQLAAQAGIPQLEVVDPAEPGFAQRAKALLSRDG